MADSLILLTMDILKICVPDKVNILNLKEFNSMASVKETRLLVKHESCECKFGLNKIAYSSNQKFDQG